MESPVDVKRYVDVPVGPEGPVCPVGPVIPDPVGPVGPVSVDAGPVGPVMPSPVGPVPEPTVPVAYNYISEKVTAVVTVNAWAKKR